MAAGLVLFSLAAEVRADIAYREQVRFSSPEGTSTNHFEIRVADNGVKVEMPDGRSILFHAAEQRLQVRESPGGALSDWTDSSRLDARFGPLRESMDRLVTILAQLPPGQARALQDELTELRRELRDTMRGVLPWSPCAGAVADLESWTASKPVERFGLSCRVYERSFDAGRYRRQIVVARWEDLEIDAGLLERMNRFETGWMQVLGSSNGASPGADGLGSGFVLEERELHDRRTLWEVLRDPPARIPEQADEGEPAVPAGANRGSVAPTIEAPALGSEPTW